MSCKLGADIYTIYILRNKTNDKVYIGQTSRSLHVRLTEHQSKNSGCIKLQRAISKYSFDNFQSETLCIVYDLPTANFLEKFYITLFDSIENGYNLMDGGSNGKPSLETRKLMSEQHQGEKNVMFGKHHTQTVKDTISAKKKGQPGYWEGKSLSQETKDKVSASRKGLTAGENNPSAKLTREQVEEIKSLFQNSDLTRQQIADRYNVSLSAIKRIKAGKAW